jgi:hypothetical protein
MFYSHGVYRIKPLSPHGGAVVTSTWLMPKRVACMSVRSVPYALTSMNVPINGVELLVAALREAKEQSGVATMRVAATTVMNIRHFDVIRLFDRLVKLCDIAPEDDRDVLCVALACTLVSGQRQAGVYTTAFLAGYRH